MVIYPNTQANELPKEFVINPFKVLISKNIKFHEATGDKDAYYEFDLYEYSPSEYIEILKNTNSELKQELLNTQMALCDVYEAIL